MADCIRLDFFEPVKFYPYSHIVTDRILTFQTIDEPHLAEVFRSTQYHLIEKFKKAGIAAKVDNKIAFEIKTDVGNIFIGFYDCIMSIGFCVKRLL